MGRTGGGNNRTGWSSPVYDRLIREAAAEADPARRMAVLRRAETLLLAETPVLPIYFYSTVLLARPELEGIYPNLLNRIDFSLIRRRAQKESR
jgi:oligopeptide transport system substrate-binding protein